MHVSIYDNLDRFTLGKVNHDEKGPFIESLYDDVDLSFEDYSRFKYGDGAVSRQYGSALARHLIPLMLDSDETEDIYVTSSAFKVAPPASASLVEPFVGAGQAIVRDEGYNNKIIPFKIDRANLTDGDYASMGVDERDEVMRKNGLSLPVGLDISGMKVVAIDDIRVTGSHEISLDNVLRKNDVEHVTHAYILDVINGASDPTLEARINGSAVATIQDLIAVASLKHFTPNARFGKRILSESPENIDTFCKSLSLRISSRLIHDALGDGLDRMPGYSGGFDTMVDTLANLSKSR